MERCHVLRICLVHVNTKPEQRLQDTWTVNKNKKDMAKRLKKKTWRREYETMIERGKTPPREKERDIDRNRQTDRYIEEKEGQTER